jgi:hypothetical protein
MTLQEFLKNKIEEHQEASSLLQVRINGLTNELSNNVNNKELLTQIINNLTLTQNRDSFHKGCIAAYNDVLSEYERALSNENKNLI